METLNYLKNKIKKRLTLNLKFNLFKQNIKFKNIIC